MYRIISFLWKSKKQNDEGQKEFSFPGGGLDPKFCTELVYSGKSPSNFLPYFGLINGNGMRAFDKDQALSIKSTGLILRVTSSETCSVCVNPVPTRLGHVTLI